MEWIEIAAQRVLQVTIVELAQEFDRHQADDTLHSTLFVRLRDNRVFRFARIQPHDPSNMSAFLEPI